MRFRQITCLLHRHNLLLMNRSGVALDGGQRYKGRSRRCQDQRLDKHLPAPTVVKLGLNHLMDRLGVVQIEMHGRNGHRWDGRQMPPDARDLPVLITVLTRVRARQARKVQEKVDKRVEQLRLLRRLRWQLVVRQQSCRFSRRFRSSDHEARSSSILVPSSDVADCDARKRINLVLQATLGKYCWSPTLRSLYRRHCHKQKIGLRKPAIIWT